MPSIVESFERRARENACSATCREAKRRGYRRAHARAAVPTTHHDAPRRVLIRCCVPFVCSARSRLGIFISSSTTSPHSWSRCARSASSSRPSLGVGSGGTGIPSLAASVLIGASTRRRVSMASAGALTCVVYTFSLSDLFSASLLLYLVCAHTSLLLFLMTSSMHRSTHVLCGVVRRWRQLQQPVHNG